jgi:hypothetical protein
MNLTFKKSTPSPSHPPSTYIFKKNLDPPSLATQQWKFFFEKETNLLPLLLPHVK